MRLIKEIIASVALLVFSSLPVMGEESFRRTSSQKGVGVSTDVVVVAMPVAALTVPTLAITIHSQVDTHPQHLPRQLSFNVDTDGNLVCRHSHWLPMWDGVGYMPRSIIGGMWWQELQ